MSKDELVAILNTLNKDDGDPEADHMHADRALLDYIDDAAVTRAFEDVHRWYA